MTLIGGIAGVCPTQTWGQARKNQPSARGGGGGYLRRAAEGLPPHAPKAAIPKTVPL